MFLYIAILLSLVAFVIAFFSTLWAWVVLAPPIVFLLVLLMSLKLRRWRHIPELSAGANAMLQKYGHFYTMPFAGRDFSGCSSTFAIAGAVVAIIGCFKGFWWGLVIGLVNWVVMTAVAKSFNPTVFITAPLERLAHEEVISFIMSKRGAAVPEA